MEQIKFNKINNTTNPILSESFSIGLTLLQAGLLFNADSLYDLSRSSLDFRKL
jgi:hypothetical protein